MWVCPRDTNFNNTSFALLGLGARIWQFSDTRAGIYILEVIEALEGGQRRLL